VGRGHYAFIIFFPPNLCARSGPLCSSDKPSVRGWRLQRTRSRLAGVGVLFAVGNVLPQLAGAEALFTKWARPQRKWPAASTPSNAAMRRLDPLI